MQKMGDITDTNKKVTDMWRDLIFTAECMSITKLKLNTTYIPQYKTLTNGQWLTSLDKLNFVIFSCFIYRIVHLVKEEKKWKLYF